MGPTFFGTKPPYIHGNKILYDSYVCSVCGQEHRIMVSV